MSLRISLKWFLLICVALVIPAAYVLRPWVERLRPDDREQREARRAAAIARLTEMGAILRYDGNRVVEVELPLTVQNPPSLTFIADLTELERLKVGPRADDELVHALAGLTELRELHLHGPEIANDALRTIGKLRRLKFLSLGGTKIDDQGLAHLRNLEYLHTLDLQSTPIRGSGLLHLAKLKGLESLHLPRTQVDDQSLVALGRLTHLRQLHLDQTAVKGPGLAHLRGCRHLYSLSLNGLNLTDLSAIAELDRLHSLSFGHTQVPPQELRHVSGMERLVSVGLDGPMYTDEHLAALSDADQVREVYVTRWRPGLSEQGLGALGSMDRLESLTINGVISEEEAQRLSQKLPKVAIILNSRSSGRVHDPQKP